MKRADLEHLIRAAGAITCCRDIVVVGSQSILGAFPEAPAPLTLSAEADLFPLDAHDAERMVDLIDGALGELSIFHEQYQYYAQGVIRTTSVLPKGWAERLVVVENANTSGFRGLCLDPHDLVLAKYAASREKDHQFNRAAIRHGLVRQEVLLARVIDMPLDLLRQAQITQDIQRDFREATGNLTDEGGRGPD